VNGLYGLNVVVREVWQESAGFDKPDFIEVLSNDHADIGAKNTCDSVK
jgi:hypothetical protein